MSGDYDESEYMSVDPAYSQSSSSDSSSSGGMCSEEDDNPYHSEEDLMSIAPEDREPNMTMADGSQGYSDGYSSGYSREEAALCSYDYASGETDDASYCDDFYAGYSSGSSSSSYPMASYISDIPTSPHVVLESDALMSAEAPTLDVIGIDAGGKQDAYDINMQPGETARIYWQAYNATRVEVDGQSVDTSGSMGILYQENLAGSYRIYEIKAWNDETDYPVTHYVQANMSYLLGLTLRFFHKEIPIPKNPVKKNFRYFSFTPKGKIKLNGTWTVREGVVVLNAKGKDSSLEVKGRDGAYEYSDKQIVIKDGNTQKTVGAKEIGYQIKDKFKQGEWEAEPEFELKVKRKDPNLRHVAQVELSVAGGITYTYKFKMPEGHTLSFAVQFTLKAFEISTDADNLGKTDWGINVFDAEAKGSLNYTGELKTSWGTFKGDVTGELVCEVEPNWSAIISDLMKVYGPKLIVGAATFFTAPATIAVVTVGGLVYGVHQIIVVNEPSRFRKESLQGYIDSITKGVEDGLSGVDSLSQTVNIVDEDTAYRAGLSAGTQRRKALEDEGDYFEDKDPSAQSELMREVRTAAAEDMKLKLWIGKAIELKGDGSSGLYMQMSWWNNLIGNSPAAKTNPRYMENWKKYRAGEYGDKYYSGNW